MSANTTTSPIVGQAVIVVTEGPEGRFQIRSFESPEGPSTAAGEWADRIVRLVHDAVTGAVVDGATDAELARLRRVESAAGEVLAGGQARYTHLADDGEYVGDLIPAAKMMALAEAVHGGQVVEGKPPVASDEYARELEAVLFGEATGDGSGEALPRFDAGIERTAPAADTIPCPECRRMAGSHKMSCGHRAELPVRLDAVMRSAGEHAE